MAASVEIKEAALVLSSKLDSLYVRLFKLAVSEFNIEHDRECTFFLLFDSLLGHEVFQGNVPRAVAFSCHVLSRFNCESNLYSSLQRHGERGFNMRDLFPSVDTRLVAVETLYNLKEQARVDAIDDLIQNRLEVSLEIVDTISELVLLLFQRGVLKPEDISVVEKYSINTNTLSRSKWRGRKPPDEIRRVVDDNDKRDLRRHKRKLLIGFILGLVSFVIAVLVGVLFAVSFARPIATTRGNTSYTVTQRNYPFLLKITNNTGRIELSTSLTTPLSVYSTHCDHLTTMTEELDPYHTRVLTPTSRGSQIINYNISRSLRLLPGSVLNYNISASFRSDNNDCQQNPPRIDLKNCLHLFLFESEEEWCRFMDNERVNVSECIEFGDNVTDPVTSEIVFNIHSDSDYRVAVRFPQCIHYNVTIFGTAVYYSVPSDATQVCNNFHSDNNCKIERSCVPFCYEDEETCLLFKYHSLPSTSPSVCDNTDTALDGAISYQVYPALLVYYRTITFFVGVVFAGFLLICFFLSSICCCLFCCCTLYDCMSDAGPHSSTCI